MDAVAQSQKDASLSHTGIERLQNDNAHPTGGWKDQEPEEPTLGGKTCETGSERMNECSAEPATVYDLFS